VEEKETHQLSDPESGSEGPSNTGPREEKLSFGLTWEAKSSSLPAASMVRYREPQRLRTRKRSHNKKRSCGDELVDRSKPEEKKTRMKYFGRIGGTRKKT